MSEYKTGDKFKVKITSKEFEPKILRGTTVGKVYDAIFTKRGDLDPDYLIPIRDLITIIDDNGDKATIWFSDRTSYEIVS